MEAATRQRSHLETWRAMGTDCRALIVGDDAIGAVEGAQQEISRLEGRWSRFLPDSDVRRLNEAAGAPVPVHRDTADLVLEAIAWWDRTAGRFDPTVLRALEAAGYDRDRALGHGPIGEGHPAPGCGGVVVDLVAGTVRLSAGTGIDLGGIGKGAAADRVADALRHHPGGLVDLGGDLRVWGDDPDLAGGWAIAVDDPRLGRPVALLGLREGAMATSTTLRRAWARDGRRAHHLIDPRTGRPVQGELVGVTVVAPTATMAEVLAKSAIVSGSIEAGRSLLDAYGLAGLLVPVDGPVVPVGDFEAMCWTAPGGLV